MTRTAWLWPLLASAALCAPACSDDWAQFRRDAEHSAFSKDPVKLPLAEIWSWSPPAGRANLYQAALFKGKVYFFSFEDRSRFLVCADARTGTVAWRQPLNAFLLGNDYSNTVGPAVSEDGVVYVYDQVTAPHVMFVATLLPGVEILDSNKASDRDTADKLQNTLQEYARGYFGLTRGVPPLPAGFRLEPYREQGFPCYRFSSTLKTIYADPMGKRQERQFLATLDVAVSPVDALRTFSAVDGQPGPSVALDPWLNRAPINYTALLHPPLPTGYASLPGVGSVAFPADGLGPFTLKGGALYATSASSNLVQWRPFGAAAEPPIHYTTFHHPLPKFAMDSTPTAALSGRAPLVLDYGVVVGDDQQNRFLGFLPTQAQRLDWHQDLRGALGVPAGDGSQFYVGMGGPGATDSIVAIDPVTGTSRWSYPPQGSRGDGQRVTQGVYSASPGIRTFIPGTRSLKLSERIGQLRDQKGQPLAMLPGNQLVGVIFGPTIEQPIFAFHSPPSGCWSNAGLVVTHDVVYGEVPGSVVALDRDTGAPLWSHPLPSGGVAQSLIGTKDHLFLCLSVMRGGRAPVWATVAAREYRLLALNREDGKEVWSVPVDRPGNLMAANGLLYFADGGLHVYAPAERTFRLAADSSRKDDYQLTPVNAHTPQDEKQAPTDGADAKGAPEVKTGKAQHAPPRQVADASILRLNGSDPLPDLLASARARRELVREVPLLLSLDSLDRTRSKWTFAAQKPPLSPDWITEFAAACRKLAEAVRPEYFEVLPEVNVILLQDPDHATALRDLMREVVKEVHAGSPDTQVVASVNLEVLAGRYGKEVYLPFGKLPPARPDTAQALMDLLHEADAVGITSVPQAATANAATLPPDYLLAARKLVDKKPLLVTRLAVRVDEDLEAKSPGPQMVQAAFVRRLLQSCYWLGARLVAYPEALTEAATSPLALRRQEKERQGLSEWRNVFGWKRVDALSLLKMDDEKAQEAPAAATAN